MAQNPRLPSVPGMAWPVVPRSAAGGPPQAKKLKIRLEEALERGRSSKSRERERERQRDRETERGRAGGR